MCRRTTKFERLLEAVPDALVAVDPKGVMWFVNRQSEWVFGYDRRDLIGEGIEKLVPETPWHDYMDHPDDVPADPSTRSHGFDLELSGRQQDGTTFPANITVSHVDTGNVLLSVTAVGDVARLKRGDKHAELIEAIVRSSDDFIISRTLDGIITSWNPAAERMYGYPSEEIVGKSAALLVPEDRTGEVDAVLAKISSGEHVESFETIRVRKDGAAVPVWITASPIRDSHDVVVGASVIGRGPSEQG